MSPHPRIPPFRAADPDKFREEAPQFAEFLNFASGRLWALINSEPAYIQMAVYTFNGMPALAALTHRLAPLILPVDEQVEGGEVTKTHAENQRKAIGSMVRAVMEANGFNKTGTKRAVPPEPQRLFRAAEIFVPRPQKGPGGDVAKEDFDWDRFLTGASFAEVRRLSPEMDGRRPPSLYSPDRDRFYLSSQDLDVACGDEEELRAMFDEMMRSWTQYKREPLARLLKLHQLRVDIAEVAGLLSKLVSDPEEFADFEVRMMEA